MNKYFSGLIIGLLGFGMTSCNDFLDRMPESSLTGEGYFNDASQLAAYSLPFYTLFPVSSGYDAGTFGTDNGTDNQAGISASSRYIPGQWLTSSAAWSFSTIRQINYFFAMAQDKYDNNQITGSQADINQAMGEMHFFRAYAYFNAYSTYGDYPCFTVLPSENKEELLELSKRQPRNKVARFILDELTEAINLLPETSNKSKQGLNKACAQLFRSRVALFEGTWLKYHKGTALVPGGPGWPGNAADLEGFNIDNEIKYFLTEAMTSAKPVADAVVNNLVNNTDTKEGLARNLTVQNPYYAMFCETNLDSYSEVLLYKQFNTTQSVTSNVQMQLERNGANTGWTRGMVNSFLMRNGLPIYATGSGYDPEWENQGVTATLQNRDSRIQIFTKGDDCIGYYGDSEASDYMWNMSWLINGSSDGTRCVTGYGIKKGKHYNQAWANTHYVGTSGSIVFRATEAMLNYMEASYELNNTVDNSATSYWKALRNRAKVDEDFNKTIAATNMAEEAKGDWGAYSHGALVNTTLYNIRRERRNELCAEALRLNDLRRWCAMDQLITNPYQIEGIKFWGTCYDKSAGVNPLNLQELDWSGPATVTVDLNNGTGNMSDPTISGPYVRPYQITRIQNLVFDGLSFTRAHYLSPLGQNTFEDASPDGKLENTVVYQNPGWPMVSGQGATNIN